MSNDSRNARTTSTFSHRNSILGAAVTPLLEALEGRSLFTVNVVPTAVAGGPYSVNEGSSVLISGLNSTDSDGTVATYQWDTNYSVSKGFKNRLGGGTWTFTADDSGTRTIALRVVDNNGGVSGISTATINIADVAPTITLTAPTTANEASPVAISWSHTDAGLSDTVTAWDVDWGDDTTSTYAGTATAGTHTYDENGNYAITLTSTQADATTSVTHNITINNVTPIVTVTSPHTTIDEGEMAQVSFASPNRAGSLDGWTIDWGDGKSEALSATRSVAAHFYTDSGNYTATVSAQEPDGGSGSSTINFTVNNVGATVAQTGVPGTGNEGTAITIGSTVTDPGQDDTETYGWTVYRNGSQFSLPGGTTLDGTSFTFTPTDNGSYVVRLSVMDDEGAITTVNSSPIVVGNVNPTATITGAPVGAINEGVAVNLTAVPADAGSEDSFSYAWSVTKNGSAFALPNGAATTNAAFTFTPTDNGSYIATVIVTDDDTGTVSVSTAAITVNNIAPTATITGEPVSSAEGAAITLGAHPADAGTVDTFTYSWSVEKDGNPYALGVTPINQAAFTFTPNDNGSYVARVVVTDDDGGNVGVNSAAITVTNVAPTALLTAPVAGDEGAALNFSVAPSDAGSADTFSYAWSVTKGGNAYNVGGATINTDAFTFTPTDDGAYVVSVVVTDKDGATVTKTGTVNVVNLTPVASITGTPGSSAEATQISLGSSVTDAGTLDTFSYAWSVAKGGVAYNVGGAPTTNDTFDFTPSDNGTYVVTLAVTDNGGLTRTVSSSAITVTNVNPTASVSGEPVAPIGEGAQVDLTAAGLDVSSVDTLGYAWAITKDGVAYTPPSGTVLNDAALSFVPVDNGTYVATVTVTDDDAGTVTASSNPILVFNADPIAAITGAPANSAEGTQLNLNASVTDDGVLDTHTYAWTVTKDGNPVDLTGITSNTAAFNFTPRDNGAYVVSLAVTDKDNGVSTTSANVNVTNVTPAPVISGNSTVNEDAAITLTVAAHDAGADDTQTYLWSVTKGGVSYVTNLGATNGTSFTFTPNLYGTYVVSCLVTDKDNASATATKTITVGNVAPTAAVTGLPGSTPNEGDSIGLTSTATDASGETGLTYAWSVKRGGVTFPLPGGTVTNTDTFTFIPTDNGQYTVTLAVTDSGGLTTTSTTGNITVANAAPTAAITGAPVGAINEGTAVSLHVNAADVSTEDTLTYNWSVTKGGAAYGLPGGTDVSGVDFAFTPTDNGTYIASVTVMDDDAGTVSVATAAITVNNVAPTASIGGLGGTGTEGTALTATSTVGDVGSADVSSIAYAWSVDVQDVNAAWQPVTLPGSVVTTGTGFSFVPANNGTYRVNLVVTDKDSGTTTAQSGNIVVANANPAPVISGNSSVNEGQALTLTVAANDPGVNDTATYLWSVTKGGVSYTTGLGATNAASFSFTPNLYGTYVVSAQVTDNDGGVATATKTITVNNVAPTAAITGMPSGPRGEGSPITLHGTSSDVSGEAGLTYAWAVKRNNVTFPLPGGTVTNTTDFEFTPTDNGLYRVTFAVTDSGGLTTTATTSNITVTNALPDAAITGEPGSAIGEGTPVTLHVDAADPGSEDTLSYQWSVTKNGAAFTLPNGTNATGTNFTFTPTNEGTYVAKVIVTDDDGGPVQVSSAGIVVNNVAPVAAISGAPVTATNEGSAIALTAAATDAGSLDVLTYSWSVTKNGSPFTLPAGTNTTGSGFSFVPTDNGSYVVTMTVSDGTATDSISTAALTVNNVAPTGSISGPATGNEGSPLTLTATATDAGSLDVLTYAWTATKDGQAFTFPGGTITNAAALTFTPADNGAYAFTCTVSDGTASTPLTHSVTVNNVAPAVTLTGVPTTGLEGTAITIGSTVTDAGTDTQAYGWSVYRNGSSFTLPGGTVTDAASFTFTPTDNGSYVIRLTATDDDNGATTQNSSAVAVANVAPVVAITGTATANEGSLVSLATTVTDAGSLDTAFTYAWTVTRNGSAYALPNGVATNASTLAFTPNNDGAYVASVVVTDKDGTSTTQTKAITVANVAPTASISTATGTVEGTAISVTATAADAGTADVLTYGWSVEKDGSPFVLPNGTNTTGAAFSFVPTNEGAYVITLSVGDGTTTTAVSTATLNVSNVAPTGTIAGPASGDEGSELTLTVTASDAGTADTLTYGWTVIKDGDTVTLPNTVATDGPVLYFTPADEGDYVFLATVSDGTDSHELVHTVHVANVAPTVSLTNVPSTGAEGTAITVGSNASDVVDDSLTYGWTVYRDGEHYTLSDDVETDGTSLTFTPSDDGNYVVRLSVTDGDTGITTKNSTAIAVANVAPVVVSTDTDTAAEGDTVTFSVAATDAGSDDEGAGFTYGWTAELDGETVASGEDAEFSFLATMHGEYTITSIVTDKDGSATTTVSTMDVDNIAPSNVEIDTDLDGLVEGDDVTVNASAEDPSGEDLTYGWQVKRGESVFASGTGPEINFTAGRGGYELVVTATDSADDSATQSFDFYVDNVAPTADMTAPTGTVLTGATANFALSMADVPANQALTVNWDFGDNTTASGSYTGSQTVNRKHAYAAHGNYTVTATISDGVDSTIVTQTVTIGEAIMAADPLDASKTALIVVGSSANDTIVVMPSKGNRYGVTFNGDNLGSSFSPTGRIYVYGNGGSNTISVSGNANAVVFAGAAGSTVTTGAGNDIVVGSAGIDRLNGGAGRDILIGAAGADILHGNDGEDLIIAGSTTKMTDNATLNALSAQWNANTAVGSRRTAIKNLFGKQLVADTGSNQLYGDAGNDWMIYGNDKLKDVSKTDVLN